jgi:AcrR family transcriptional regulator
VVTSAVSLDRIDGRRLRSEASRARIVEAMLELTRAGIISPSAEQVALRAGVGLRTVFRHFTDLESLFAEMGEAIEVELRALADEPFVGATWRERVLELVARRGEGFEVIAPFRRAADPLRHGSPALQSDHAKLTEALRDILLRQLPDEVSADAPLVEALDLLLSYEAWDRLRGDQRLSPDAARAALSRAVSALLA